MREIKLSEIKRVVYDLFLKINTEVSSDVLDEVKKAYEKETGKIAKIILEQIIENTKISKDEGLPLCQDTGTAVVFIEIGDEVFIKGNLNKAIEDGIFKAYRDGYFRKGIVKHPLDRENTGNNLPASIYIDIKSGDKLKIMAMAKGGGSENACRLYMFNPTTTEDEIVDKVVDELIKVGGKACPPIFIGMCIGGDFSRAPITAKKLLFNTVGEMSSDVISSRIAKKIMKKLNESGMGPMGLGGDTTCLWVWCECLPCHIATLPVALCISCHSLRRKTTYI
ncbi:MAG: fumarate hydratase [bacterium]